MKHHRLRKNIKKRGINLASEKTGRQYWLMKSEPYAFGIDDLIRAKNQTTAWDGIRNYEARNIMRDKMKTGDCVFFYHSNIKEPAIVGTMEVCTGPYPDPTQFDPHAKYFDPKSSRDNPRWILVDVTFVQKFEKPVTREFMKGSGHFNDMALFKRIRLSVQPVTKEEWFAIHELAGAKPI